MRSETPATGRPDPALTRSQRARLETRLLQARQRALEDMSRFAEGARASGPDAAGDLSRFPVHAADEGSDTMRQEVAFAIATGTGEQSSQIDEALRLLYEEPGRYGTCRNCGRAIPFERLDLIPWAQLCEVCESASEAAAGTPHGAGGRETTGSSRPEQASAVTLRSIMSTDVLTLHPEATIREAVVLFTDKGISGAPVVRGARILGVISASDILEFNASTPGIPVENEDRAWGEWQMPEEGEEGSEPPSVYFLDLWLESGADLSERFALAGPEWDVLEEHTVAEIMTRRLCTLSADTPLADAAGYMLRAGIHRALVVEEERLIGVVTTTDFLRAIAQGRT